MFKIVEPQMERAWLPESLLGDALNTSTHGGLLDWKKKKKTFIVLSIKFWRFIYYRCYICLH